MAPIAFLIVPIWAFWIGLQPLERLEDEDFQERFGAFYEGKSMKRKNSRYQGLVFCIRRLVTIVLLLFMSDYGSGLVCVCIFYLNLFSFVYNAKYIVYMENENN